MTAGSARWSVRSPYPPPAQQALYLRPDELHQAFYFDLLHTPWNVTAFRQQIGAALHDIASTGAPVTWVLFNHDQQRTVTRYSRTVLPGQEPDLDRGAARALAAALLMLALPGSAYLYQGEELGLPEVTDLPLDALTDPIVAATGRPAGGRDGCRVPLPWSGVKPPFGFTDADTDLNWLPQPDWFDRHTVQLLRAKGESCWHTYRDALHLRRTLPALRDPSLRWLADSDGVLAFGRGEGFVCAVNFTDTPVTAPVQSAPVLSSQPCDDGKLAANTAAWWIVGPTA